MQILVFNAGSSSLKYQLIDMSTEDVRAKGLVQRIGEDGSSLTHEAMNREKIILEKSIKSHKEAIAEVLDALQSPVYGVIQGMDEISGIGHRVVHGGDYFSEAVVVDDEVVRKLNLCAELAPLHNPPNILGITSCAQIAPGLPQVAVFDTAFHQTMTPEAYHYAIPYELYEEFKIRRYGFHGTSHKYVSQEAAKILGKPIEELRMVTAHLGNGSSLAAIRGGKVVDTSMGFTPLAGVPMGTRCGDIDPAIVTFLMKKKGLDESGVEALLNKKSGVAGISGLSNDFRDLVAAAGEGHERAELALRMFSYSVKKFVGSYAAAMGGLDALILTGGVGENGPLTRERIVSGLEFLGIEIDSEQNMKRVFPNDISTPNARVRTLVIATNEERMIARETAQLICS